MFKARKEFAIESAMASIYVVDIYDAQRQPTGEITYGYNSDDEYLTKISLNASQVRMIRPITDEDRRVMAESIIENEIQKIYGIHPQAKTVIVYEGDDGKGYIAFVKTDLGDVFNSSSPEVAVSSAFKKACPFMFSVAPATAMDEIGLIMGASGKVQWAPEPKEPVIRHGGYRDHYTNSGLQ